MGAGCRTASNRPVTAVTPQPVPPRPAGDAVVAAGSTAIGTSTSIRSGLLLNIVVLVSGHKEVEETSKRVSDSGTVTLPMLGTVPVSGATLDELSRRLSLAYEAYYVKPQVIVEFVRDDAREGLSPWGYVTVLGRVKRPGRVAIPATRDLTVSGAIQQAGGFDTSAKDTEIRITRRLADGRAETRAANLHAVGAEGQTDEDIMLNADDVVYVPELRF